LGHPLGDLGWACRPYHCPPGIDGVLSFQGMDLKAAGIPSEEEFVAAYCRRHRTGNCDARETWQRKRRQCGGARLEGETDGRDWMGRSAKTRNQNEITKS